MLSLHYVLVCCSNVFLKICRRSLFIVWLWQKLCSLWRVNIVIYTYFVGTCDSMQE